MRSLALGGRAHAVLGHSTGHFVVLSLLWSVGIVAVFAPVAVSIYRRK